MPTKGYSLCLLTRYQPSVRFADQLSLRSDYALQLINREYRPRVVSSWNVPVSDEPQVKILNNFDVSVTLTLYIEVSEMLMFTCQALT